MLKAIKNLIVDDAGISSVEYAVLLAFIVAGLIAVVQGLSGAVQGRFTTATNEIAPAAP
ncbi:MAG TPA: Flp family type IVb pilin [Nitrospiria bacterium]